VIKASAHTEQTPRHWHDALGLWEYLLRRSRCASRRVLSLLIYAESADVRVPQGVVGTLFDRVYGARAGPRSPDDWNDAASPSLAG